MIFAGEEEPLREKEKSMGELTVTGRSKYAAHPEFLALMDAFVDEARELASHPMTQWVEVRWTGSPDTESIFWGTVILCAEFGMGEFYIVEDDEVLRVLGMPPA